MIEYLEENGYDVSYVSQSDLSAPGAASLIEQHKVLVTAGHSEYFDAGDRTNIQAAVNAGVNATFFSGNLMWWKTRWANSQYGNEPDRTLITYKESLDNTQSDPSDPPTWTGAWRDPRFSPPADGGQPENALTGQLWLVNCCSYADQVPAAYSALPLWENTAVANLPSGQTYTMPQETLGYEWDSDVDNGFRPAGEIDMSQTCENASQVLLTVNERIGPGYECNSLTLYRASSGALVFDAGTVQWAWGLNNVHDGDQVGTDQAMQQATVNLFSMMGVQPTTLMSGLVAGPTLGSGTTPSSTVTAPSAGASVQSDSTVTVTGTATDSGGGVVAGVEVSTDGGNTWHPATSMSADAANVTWSYTWSADGVGQVTIESRATDSNMITENPGPGVTVNVNCPCSLFGQNYVPTTTSSADTAAYELGVKFQATIPGWVVGVRFYKGANNNGTHTGSLWTGSGTLLATGTFTNETASGWQTLDFTNPILISANTTYVVGYYDPDGYYASDYDEFDWQINTPPLIALKSNYMSATGGNGLYNPGGPGFPTHSYQGTSYGVDVIFDSTQPKGAPPSVVSSSPVAASSSNPLPLSPTVSFSEPVQPSTVTYTVTQANGVSVPGSVSFDSTDEIATFTPNSGLAAGTTYNVSVSGATDNFGQVMTAYTSSFTTSKAFDANGACPCAVWPDVPPSNVTDASDSSSVELGVKFTPSSNGTITGVRFYKVPDNTGTHTGSLWTASGAQLATGTFTNESSQGWEELDFSTPVTVTAGTTYVASYHTNGGHYSITSGGLSSAVTNGPLTAVASGGVYTYASSTTFPKTSYKSSNYWVDVVFQPDTNPPTATTMPSNQATSVPVTSTVTMTFNKAIQSGTAVFSLTDPNGNAVAGTTSLNSAATVLTFTPTSSLLASTTYSASLSGATSTSGVPMSAPDNWTFTTSGTGACPCSIFESDAVPAVVSANDSHSVNLGVAFTADTNGWITGIRFYKGANNTGTHIGSLWSSTGTLLGQVTFTNETASGWQTAVFASPIQVTANTTYVASYFAPNGYYADNSGEFTSVGFDNSPLHALPSTGFKYGNGLYLYGSSAAFPTKTSGGSNYWVDVLFQTTP